MSGGGSFTSDQSVAHATADGQMVATGRRARVTYIQAEGAASSSVVLKSGGASGTVVATFKFGTEGLDVYVPGSGILFEEGVYLDLTATPAAVIPAPDLVDLKYFFVLGGCTSPPLFNSRISA